MLLEYLRSHLVNLQIHLHQYLVDRHHIRLDQLLTNQELYIHIDQLHLGYYQHHHLYLHLYPYIHQNRSQYNCWEPMRLHPYYSNQPNHCNHRCHHHYLL